MRWPEVRERARKRLAHIAATQDSGVYAKHYVEDVTALLEALEEDEGLIDRLAKENDPLLGGDP